MGIISSARWKLQQAWRRGPIRLPIRGMTDDAYATDVSYLNVDGESSYGHAHGSYDSPADGSYYWTADGSQRKSKASLFAIILLVAVGIFWALHGDGSEHERVGFHRGLPGFKGPITVLSGDVVPCVGPGMIVDEDQSLQFEGRAFDEPTPQPWAGSYSALGLKQQWITADERYGPYGRPADGESTSESEVASKARSSSSDWEDFDWAEAQTQCAFENRGRFYGEHRDIHSRNRLNEPSWNGLSHFFSSTKKPKARPKTRGGRTAIVLRAWSTFHWGDEDIWSLRSLITETALASNGEYGVYILMDVKEEHAKGKFWRNEELYQKLLDTLVPREFRDMTILFNIEMLKLWYPKVGAWDSEHQMFQPLQLFAHQFPEYDYFWTMEMDVRFTGHTLSLLSAFTTFARSEPRKQARHRLSHYYLPSRHASYDNFLHSIDKALNGGDAYYTGVRIPDIPHPISPSIPYAKPEDDDFTWGVGEEADFITFSPANNVSIHDHWLYTNWIRHFTLGVPTPGRLICPVTISRTSFNLLNAVHHHQRSKGLAVQSESTMASFALWHGLKLSLPPLPMYSRGDHYFTASEVDRYVNGGRPNASRDGMAWGEWVYGDKFKQDTRVDGGIEPTYRFKTSYPQEIWEAWMGGGMPGREGGPSAETRSGYPKREDADNDDAASTTSSTDVDVDADPELPWNGNPAQNEALRANAAQYEYEYDVLPSIFVKDGKVYLPNTMLHPVKTNAAPKESLPGGGREGAKDGEDGKKEGGDGKEEGGDDTLGKSAASASHSDEEGGGIGPSDRG